MKKILILLVIIPTYVWGEIYTPWTDIYNSQLEIYQTEDRFLWFKEKSVGKYLEYNEKSNEYPLLNEEKITLEDYSKWAYPCPVSNQEKYDIEYQYFYGYRDIKKVRYLIIWYSNKPLEFINIEINNNDNNINYSIISCPSCVNKNIIMNKNEKIIIDLNNYYDMKDLKLKFETNINDSRFSFGVGLYVDQEAKEKCGGFTGFTNIQDYPSRIEWLENKILDDYYPSENKISENTYTYGYGKLNFCHYRKYYQYHYKIEKEYYDNNYYNNLIGYTKDENSKKTFYQYYIKEDNNEIVTDNILPEVKEQKGDEVKVKNTSTNQYNKENKRRYCLGLSLIIIGLILINKISKKVVQNK